MRVFSFALTRFTTFGMPPESSAATSPSRYSSSTALPTRKKTTSKAHVTIFTSRFFHVSSIVTDLAKRMGPGKLLIWSRCERQRGATALVFPVAFPRVFVIPQHLLFSRFRPHLCEDGDTRFPSVSLAARQSESE